MLTSLALIFLSGILLGAIFKKLKLPSLIGMILTGILLGPYVLNLLDDSILSISADLRQLALVIILTRAGLALDLKDLKNVGRPAILMCFVPACFEIIGVIILAPLLLDVTLLEAAIMGTVVAAVSPAIIVPRMLKLMQNGYGKTKSIPQLILAGASVDDVFVIVLFTSFVGLEKGGSISWIQFLKIPASILLGLGVGLLVGMLFTKLFKTVHIRDSIKVLLLLSVSFLLVAVEHHFENIIPFSGLLGIMAMGIAILKSYEVVAKRLSNKFSKLWVGAELLLFVLVGATVNIHYALTAGVIGIVIIIGALLFRMAGVLLSLMKTKLNKKERVFCVFAYLPKATVQAAIGTIPLSLGLACGEIVLTIAVLSILVTAPLGAILIDSSYRHLLKK